ncbi:MAG TPA: lanthionine synthetase C family protein [Haliangium sp.]|nr:lanthionine synthetase C family protein [Haliangium sp.]
MAGTGQDERAAWQPIAEGALAARIHAAVAELAVALGARLDQAAERAPGDHAADGRTGTRAEQHAQHALLRAYLASAMADEAHADAALDSLDRAIEALATAALRPSLHGGFAGIAWVADHVQEMLGVAGDDGNAGIDAALIRMVDAGPWPFGHDLIAGLAGIGVYALARVHRPGGVALLGRVVASLDEMSENHGEDACFFTRPEWLSPAWRARYPQGFHELGMAHGTPGVIAFLARAHATGQAGARAAPLARAATRWLLGQRSGPARARGQGDGGYFPARLAPAAEPATALAWCSGDAGVALALLGAGRCLDERAWIETALALARAVATRPGQIALVVDAGLCHGAAGLAHLFQRWFQVTGEALFRDAALAWLERTLDLRTPGAGIAGYRSRGQASASAAIEWQDDPSLIHGASGIALALLAAVAPVEPAWDRLFLADL